MMAETNSPTSPSLELYADLQRAFTHFNQTLFDGRLPDCLLTLRSASRVHGYYHARRFIAPDGKLIDEIGIHPGFFTLEPIEKVMSTLVHEMVHHWQHHFGTRSPANPHNQEWANKMLAVGLHPSHTGLPGGKKTGRSMNDYILPDGLFVRVCGALVASGFALPWMDRHVPARPQSIASQASALEAAGIVVGLTPAPITTLPQMVENKPTVWEPSPPKEKTRFRYECTTCGSLAWAAKDASFLCGACKQTLQQR
jgi:hypothetical protein